MAEVSASLGVSARTLARKVADDGLTYHAIITTIRQRIARRLLSASSLSVTDISSQLGFTDSSSFVRSFRTWFGQSPGQWRKLNG